MRGSAGINLGNLISGAVVPTLNISISPELAAGAGAGPVVASSSSSSSSWGETDRGSLGVSVCWEWLFEGGWVGEWAGGDRGKTHFDKQINPAP